jgi:DNA polymerase-1
MSKSKVQEVKNKLIVIQETHRALIETSPVIDALNLLLQHSAWDKDYETRKAKAKNPGKILPKNLAAFDDTRFNPNSGPQLQRLLYEQMGLPVLDLTDTKQPATGAETIEKLVNHTTEPSYKKLLESLIGYSKVTKVLSTFIPAFERALSKDNSDTVWLHGSFNLGGTVSGRLSSSDPNLQNIPAGSTYAKLIKECFVGPEDWLFAGADFNSLEAMIDALTTQDPKKMGVYTDGYDSHSYNAFTYWPEKMPDISSDIAKAETSISFCLVEYSDGTKEYIAQ